HQQPGTTQVNPIPIQSAPSSLSDSIRELYHPERLSSGGNEFLVRSLNQQATVILGNFHESGQENRSRFWNELLTKSSMKERSNSFICATTLSLGSQILMESGDPDHQPFITIDTSSQ